MFRVNNKKKGKASGLFLACMPSKQHAPAPACHDKKPCRPYSYSRAGHAHVSAQPPLIGQWCEKKKRSHIRNVDGLHTSVKYQCSMKECWQTALAWSHAPQAKSPTRCTIAGSPHVLLHLTCRGLDSRCHARRCNPLEHHSLQLHCPVATPSPEALMPI